MINIDALVALHIDRIAVARRESVTVAIASLYRGSTGREAPRGSASEEEKRRFLEWWNENALHDAVNLIASLVSTLKLTCGALTDTEARSKERIAELEVQLSLAQSRAEREGAADAG